MAPKTIIGEETVIAEPCVESESSEESADAPGEKTFIFDCSDVAKDAFERLDQGLEAPEPPLVVSNGKSSRKRESELFVQQEQLDEIPLTIITDCAEQSFVAQSRNSVAPDNLPTFRRRSTSAEEAPAASIQTSQRPSRAGGARFRQRRLRANSRLCYRAVFYRRQNFQFPRLFVTAPIDRVSRKNDVANLSLSCDCFWFHQLVDVSLNQKIAPSIGLVDKPGFRKIHETPIPTGGGLGVWLGVLVRSL